MRYIWILLLLFLVACDATDPYTTKASGAALENQGKSIQAKADAQINANRDRIDAAVVQATIQAQQEQDRLNNQILSSVNQVTVDAMRQDLQATADIRKLALEQTQAAATPTAAVLQSKMAAMALDEQRQKQRAEVQAVVDPIRDTLWTFLPIIFLAISFACLVGLAVSIVLRLTPVWVTKMGIISRGVDTTPLIAQGRTVLDPNKSLSPGMTFSKDGIVLSGDAADVKVQADITKRDQEIQHSRTLGSGLREFVVFQKLWDALRGQGSYLPSPVSPRIEVIEANALSGKAEKLLTEAERKLTDEGYDG